MGELKTALADHGVWLLFLLSVLEGPFVVMAATALARMEMIDLHVVWAVAILGDLLGDVLLYSAGRFMPRVLPRQYRPQGMQERAQDLFKCYGKQMLLVAKLTHFPGLPTIVSAGFGQMPVVPFLLWSLLGTALKVSAIVLTGWLFWEAVDTRSASDALAMLLGLCGCCIPVFLWLRGRRWS